MKLMICIRGESEQLPFLPEIIELGSGIELGSYGLIGIRSEQEWKNRLNKHQIIVSKFRGTIALHGPFIGIEYAHIDHLIRNAIERRLDMIFNAALYLNASRVVLHSGFTSEIEVLKLQEDWLKRNCEFWKTEILRWADAKINIVLENEIEKSPDLLIKLVDEVNNPFLGLCLDIGHLHLFSTFGTPVWVKAMGNRLHHVHVHDNDREADRHWPIGKGTIDFDSFFDVLEQYAPQTTISLEVEDKMDVKMRDLRKLAERFNINNA